MQCSLSDFRARVPVGNFLRVLIVSSVLERVVFRERGLVVYRILGEGNWGIMHHYRVLLMVWILCRGVFLQGCGGWGLDVHARFSEVWFSGGYQNWWNPKLLDLEFFISVHWKYTVWLARQFCELFVKFEGGGKTHLQLIWQLLSRGSYYVFPKSYFYNRGQNYIECTCLPILLTWMFLHPWTSLVCRIWKSLYSSSFDIPQSQKHLDHNAYFRQRKLLLQCSFNLGIFTAMYSS